MNPLIATRYAFAILLALPILPFCGYLLNAPPATVFFIGATVFIIDVVLLVSLLAISSIPPAGSPPAVKPLRFTIRDLLCLTLFLFGITVFIISAFRCAAAEEASRPNPLPAAVFRHFVWEQESGLVSMTVGALIWLRSALYRPKESPRRDFALPTAT